MLEKFGKFNRSISSWIEWVGFGALVLMMALTCVDVVGAKIFRLPVFGSLDIMMLAQLIAISFAVSMALILGRHVQVEFFILLMPKSIRKGIEIVANFLGLLLFAVIVWRLIVFGYDIQINNEESATARIPLFPFVYAAALACVPVCLVYLQQLLTSVRSVVKK